MSMLDQVIQRHKELGNLKEEYTAVIKRINEIQSLLKVIAKRTKDDYLKTELLVLYDDFGDLAHRFTMAFRKSSQEVVR